MIKKIIAAVIIVCASVTTADAQYDHGQRGGERGDRGDRGQRRRRGGWEQQQPDAGALGGFLGGVFGSWLWNQLDKPKEPSKEQYDDEEPQR